MISFKTLNEKIKDQETLHHILFNSKMDIKKQAKINQLHDEFASHYKFHNHAHSEAIGMYTSYHYDRINKQLWQEHHKTTPKDIKDSDYFKDTKKDIDNLQDALHSYKTPKAFTVFSSIRTPIEAGKLYHHPAFLSTSLHQKPPLSAGKETREDTPEGRINFHKHFLRIRVPEGHPGAYVAHVSNHLAEREFLLPHGVNLKHIHTQTFHEEDSARISNLWHYHTMEIA